MEENGEGLSFGLFCLPGIMEDQSRLKCFTLIALSFFLSNMLPMTLVSPPFYPLLQVLFYIRLVGDIMGRLAPSTWLISTSPKLLLWGVVKTAMLPLLFLSIFRPQLCMGDAGALVLIGGFWVLSGYLNTCAYLLAPKLVPSNQKARASGIMTVAFQSSCFAALILAGMVQGWLVV